MRDYEFVNVRFNLNKVEEKSLYDNLNPKNRGGHIKEILKEFLLLNDGEFFKKTNLKEIIKDIVDNEINIRNEQKIKEINHSSGINIVINGKEKKL